MNLLGLFIVILVFAFVAKSFGYTMIEGWGTSPATLIQLASSSAYYPYWQYGYGYRYPYYRYIYPYYDDYMSPYHANFPRPYGAYKYY